MSSDPPDPPELRIRLSDGVPTEPEYVAWMDIMGLQKTMLRSLDKSSIFILKLHEAAKNLSSEHEVVLYPTMDGLFVTSEKKSEIESFIRNVYFTLLNDSTDQEDKFKYIIRTGIAYGPVVHAEDISDGAAESLSENYRSNLVFGNPVIQAYRAEADSPPFGVNIDESARAFAPDGERSFNYKWWNWFYARNEDYDHIEFFKEKSISLREYFSWCKSHSEQIDYDTDDIEKHYSLLQQYSPADLEDI